MENRKKNHIWDAKGSYKTTSVLPVAFPKPLKIIEFCKRAFIKDFVVYTQRKMISVSIIVGLPLIKAFFIKIFLKPLQ